MHSRVLDRFTDSSIQGPTNKKSPSPNQKKDSPRSDYKASQSQKKLSDREIRQKLKDHQAQKIKEHEDAKVEVSKKDVEKGKDKEQLKAKDVELEDMEVESDIAKNDPNSEQTQEKLRRVLRTNAFGFSDAERQALSDILGDDDSS